MSYDIKQVEAAYKAMVTEYLEGLVVKACEASGIEREKVEISVSEGLTKGVAYSVSFSTFSEEQEVADKAELFGRALQNDFGRPSDGMSLRGVAVRYSGEYRSAKEMAKDVLRLTDFGLRSALEAHNAGVENYNAVAFRY